MSLTNPMMNNYSNQCLLKTHFLKVPTFHPFFKFNPYPYASNRTHKLSFTINCNLKNKGKNLLSQKIVLSEASPPPLTQDNDDINGGNVPVSSKNKKGFYGVVNKLSKKVFLKGPTLYAFRGLAGRLAPVGVHIALLLIMGGGTLSASGSFRGSVTVPQGLNFVVGDVLGPTGFLSIPTDAFNTEVHVNRFSMDYFESGEVSQFRTDLSLLNMDGKEVMRKTISVNDPLRYDGITIYQTDWSISALQILKDNEGPYNLAMAPLKINGDKKLYGTFLPVGDINSPDVKGISMLARDLQSIVLYDKEGKFAGVRRPNSKLPINIDGSEIVIVDAIGSSGLDLKTDPGVPVVYAGFGALMLTTCISYLSHSQIWALQDGTTVVIGGKTNRAKLEFPDEMNLLLDKIPEIVESSSLSKKTDSM
ncbi:hypothetical protein TSUD_63210, partial [Trifolium subterraneum]